MVILVPIDMANQSLFCPVFWQIFSGEPNDGSLIANNQQEERDRQLFWLIHGSASGAECFAGPYVMGESSTTLLHSLIA
jgi:hypothetical protein